MCFRGACQRDRLLCSRARTDLDFQFSQLTVNEMFRIASTADSVKTASRVTMYIVEPPGGSYIILCFQNLVLPYSSYASARRLAPFYKQPRYYHYLLPIKRFTMMISVESMPPLFIWKINMLGMNDISVPLTAEEQEELLE
jgi:hypothetical protein